MRNNNTTILLADDHVLFRQSLTLLIKDFKVFEIIGEASNGEEVIQHLEKGNIPHIVILDLNMPKMDGFETAKILKNKYPQVKVVVLTMYNSELVFLQLLQLGVKGILKKDIHHNELEKALLTIADSQQYCSYDDMNKLTCIANNKNASADFRKHILSDTEIIFLRLAATEMTYKKIAAIMNESPRKIDHLRDGLFEKLDIKNRVGLAMYATRRGLISFN
jgi:DNA-binding NarL/FixJ family response regulator